MDKKKKVHKIINISLLVIAFIYINCVAWIILQSEPETKEIIQNVDFNSIGQLAMPLLASYLFAILLYIFGPFGMITIGYVIYRFAKKRAIKKNKVHPEFSTEYFRDYLNKISPAYVSYLIDFNIDIDKDVPAHLLKLQLDGYIEEKDGNLVVTQKVKNDLKQSDLILLEFVESNFKDSHKLSYYKRAVENEMVENKYIKYTLAKNDIIKIMSAFLILPLAVNIILTLFAFITELNSSLVIEVIIGIIICLCFIIMPLGPIIFIIRLITFIKWGKIKRTDAGNELLEQIYGLKNFLSEFTNIDDSNLNEVRIREYYLVYAVVLGINDSVGDTMLDKIKMQMNYNRR